MLTSARAHLEASSSNPRVLGLFRSVFGALVLLRGIYLVEQAQTAAAQNVFSQDTLASSALASSVVVAWVGLGAALLLGWRARAASALLTALIFGLFWTDSLFYNNHLYLMALVALLLACGNPGGTFSLDARHGRSPRASAAWPQGLLTLQVSIVYAFAALSKIQEDFVSGLSLHVHLTEGPFAPLLPQAPLHSFGFLVTVSITVIVAQLFLAIGLWFKHVRRWGFLLGFMLHAPMVLLADSAHQALRLMIFSLLMWALYMLFLDVPAYGRVIRWDRSSPVIDRVMRVVARLDWLKALSFRPFDGLAQERARDRSQDRLGAALQLVEPDGRTWNGGEALERIAGVLPVSFLWAVLLPNGLLRWAGGRWVSARAVR